MRQLVHAGLQQRQHLAPTQVFSAFPPPGCALPQLQQLPHDGKPAKSSRCWSAHLQQHRGRIPQASHCGVALISPRRTLQAHGFFITQCRVSVFLISPQSLRQHVLNLMNLVEATGHLRAVSKAWKRSSTAFSNFVAPSRIHESTFSFATLTLRLLHQSLQPLVAAGAHVSARSQSWVTICIRPLEKPSTRPSASSDVNEVNGLSTHRKHFSYHLVQGTLPLPISRSRVVRGLAGMLSQRTAPALQRPSADSKRICACSRI